MRQVCVALALAFWAGAAWGADKLQYGPPEPWVRPVPIPDPTGAAGTGGALQILLIDQQLNFDRTRDERYVEFANLIRTPQGLAAGNLSFPWDPADQTVTVHKAQIIRGKQVIDLLAGGKGFTILRRETNLEMAALDGRLTATLQPEGLQVGDILDVALTYSGRDPAMGQHSESAVLDTSPIPVGKFHLGESWSATQPMRWRQTEGLPPVKVERTAGGGGRILVDVDNLAAPKPPAGAPLRFQLLDEVEATDFASWAEVSSLMWPLYDKAAALSSTSPLRAEASRIRATSTDPKVRAAMALKLVQDQIRYFYLGIDSGGLTPAPADQTWTRRFADCKGKTVVLLALLRELGIKAQPALVSSAAGDGLDERLPMAEWFDHVLIRAEIAGKVYWLDGTRTGDGAVDDIRTPDFKWALPLQTSGAALERLTPPPLEKPASDQVVRIDASAGLDAPAKVHGEMVVTADEATALKSALESLPRDTTDDYLRKYWRRQLNWVDVSSVAYAADPKTGDIRLTMDGTGQLAWEKLASGGRRFEADHDAVGFEADFHRLPGPHTDAPYAVAYPYYERHEESIVLPDKGRGFTVYGKEVDATVAARSYRRSAAIKDGVFSIVSSERTLAAEFPASEAPAAQDKLRELRRLGVFLFTASSGPAGVAAKTTPGAEPKTAQEFIDRAGLRIQQDDARSALVDLDKALALDPASTRALGLRGHALVQLGRLDDALAALDRYVAAAPKDALGYRERAFVFQTRKQLPHALAEASRAVELGPKDWQGFLIRGQIYVDMDDCLRASQDFRSAERLAPSQVILHKQLAYCATHLRLFDDAMAEAGEAARLAPNDAEALDQLAGALALAGRRDEALQAFGRSIEVRPTAEAYAGRALAWTDADRSKAEADLVMALKLDPASTDVARIRIKWLDAAGKVDEALEAYAPLLARHPDDAELLNGRCWLRATHGVALDLALADCNASIKADPGNAASRDSRGFVELRLGQLDAAIGDYDAALRLSPSQADSIYGRGLARLRHGDRPGGEGDLTAARAIDPTVDARFKGYGLTP